MKLSYSKDKSGASLKATGKKKSAYISVFNDYGKGVSAGVTSKGKTVAGSIGTKGVTGLVTRKDKQGNKYPIYKQDKVPITLATQPSKFKQFQGSSNLGPKQPKTKIKSIYASKKK